MNNLLSVVILNTCNYKFIKCSISEQKETKTPSYKKEIKINIHIIINDHMFKKIPRLKSTKSVIMRMSC